MKTRYTVALLVSLALLSSPLVARSADPAHPYDSPATVRIDSPGQQAMDAEEKHMPPFSVLTKMDDADGHGHRVHVVYTSVRMDNGVPTWHVGTASRICGSEPATPALEARIRAEFAAYTSAPVIVEPAWVASSAGGSGSSVPGAPIRPASCTN